MRRLTKEQVLMLHARLIEEFGGISGVRDENMLDSALESPFQSFGGDDLYPTIQAKGARLGYGLIRNHCMLDGNKRIGAHAMLVFLALNGIELDYTTGENWREEAEEPKAPGSADVTYVLNTSSKKIHKPSCSSVNDMKDKNKQETTQSRDKLIEEGYTPCKRCNP